VPCLVANECLDLDLGAEPPDTAGRCLVDNNCFEGIDLTGGIEDRDSLIPCMLQNDCFSDVDLESPLDERQGLVSCLLANECLDFDATDPTDILNFDCIIGIPFIRPAVCGAYVNVLAVTPCLTDPSPITCLLNAATLEAGATKILQCIEDDAICGEKADLSGLIDCATGDSGKSVFECLDENLVLGTGVSNFGSCILEEDKCADKINITDVVECVQKPESELFECVTDNVALSPAVVTLGECLTQDDKCGDKVDLQGGLACTSTCVEGDTSCTIGCVMEAIGIAPGVVTLTDCFLNEQKCANDLDFMGLVSCVQEPDANILQCVTSHVNLATGLLDLGSCVVGPCNGQFEIINMVLCAVTTEEPLIECVLDSVNLADGVKNGLRCILQDDLCGDTIDIESGIACAGACMEGDSECLAGCLVDAIKISPVLLEIGQCLTDDALCGDVFDLQATLECFTEHDDLLAGLNECAGISLPDLPSFPPNPPPPSGNPPSPPTPPTGDPSGPPSDRTPTSGTDSMAVAGGVVGAVGGVGLLAGAVFFWRKDKKRYTDSFNAQLKEGLVDNDAGQPQA